MDSAVPGPGYNSLPLNGNHITMVKYHSKEDPGYLTTVTELKRLLAVARKNKDTRWPSKVKGKRTNLITILVLLNIVKQQRNPWRRLPMLEPSLLLYRHIMNVDQLNRNTQTGINGLKAMVVRP